MVARMWVLVSCLGSLAAPELAAAQQSEMPTQYAFDDDLVRGDVFGADAEVLQTRRRGARESLIQARLHMIDRLLASVEDL